MCATSATSATSAALAHPGYGNSRFIVSICYIFSRLAVLSLLHNIIIVHLFVKRKFLIPPVGFLQCLQPPGVRLFFCRLLAYAQHGVLVVLLRLSGTLTIHVGDALLSVTSGKLVKVIVPLLRLLRERCTRIVCARRTLRRVIQISQRRHTVTDGSPQHGTLPLLGSLLIVNLLLLLMLRVQHLAHGGIAKPPVVTVLESLLHHRLRIILMPRYGMRVKLPGRAQHIRTGHAVGDWCVSLVLRATLCATVCSHGLLPTLRATLCTHSLNLFLRKSRRIVRGLRRRSSTITCRCRHMSRCPSTQLVGLRHLLLSFRHRGRCLTLLTQYQVFRSHIRPPCHTSLSPAIPLALIKSSCANPLAASDTPPIACCVL